MDKRLDLLEIGNLTVVNKAQMHATGNSEASFWMLTN